jgi:hypothetical protein
MPAWSSHLRAASLKAVDRSTPVSGLSRVGRLRGLAEPEGQDVCALDEGGADFLQ